MIVLIPVSRFRAPYEVAEGKPFSQLEWMAMKALRDGIATLDHLCSIFQVHKRLLVESLVTLTHAGWVALGWEPERQFVLTSDGHKALESGTLPETVDVTAKTAWVLLERVTGAVIPEIEVSHTSRRELEKIPDVWQKAIKLPESVFENELDESQIHMVLPRQPGQRLRGVGPIEMVSRGAHYIPVDVNLDRECIVNLPSRCDALLRPYVMEAARNAARKARRQFLSWDELVRSAAVGLKSGPKDEVQPLAWRAKWTQSDLVFSVESHVALLQTAVNGAKSVVFVASANADHRTIDRLRPEIMAAADRGVELHLMWGLNNGDLTRANIDKLKYDSGGMLKLNHEPAFSNVNMILWDGPAGFVGSVGSYEWLSEIETERAIPLSVRVSHPGVLAALARCAASLWAGIRGEGLSSVPDRWRSISAELEEWAGCTPEHKQLTHDEDPDVIQVSLALNRAAHEKIMREWSATSQSRCFIGSRIVSEHKSMGPVLTAFNDLRMGTQTTIIHGPCALRPETVGVLNERIGQSGYILRNVPRWQGNVILSDISVCISGCSLLSPRINVGDRTVRELGLVVEGKKPADQVAELLASLLSA